MPRTYRPARKDANHAEVVEALRFAGWSISDTSAVGTRDTDPPSGALDLFAAKCGITVLVEVKQPREKMNAKEQAFFDEWQGEKIVSYGGQDAVDKLNFILAKYIPF
jgi:Holliday junction resolvase-like predicted endonuclease